MEISLVKSVENKYDFSQCAAFTDLVNKFNSLECQVKILDNLKNIYSFVKEDITSKLDLNNIDCKQGDSHSKILFFEEATTHGKLKIEGMHFSGDCPTSLHTHPEFIVDEIISGTLEEKCYKFNDDSLVESDTNIRQKNCFKAEFNPAGKPHRVKAMEGPCVVLSLCLGHNKVKVLKD